MKNNSLQEYLDNKYPIMSEDEYKAKYPDASKEEVLLYNYKTEKRRIIATDSFIKGWEEAEKQKSKHHQLCPKCNGEGYCPETGTSTNATRVCPVCEGSKLIP